MQAQKQNLSQAEKLADTGVNYLREVLELAPSAAADLKRAILALFPNSDSDNDDEGNEPKSLAPTPTGGSEASELHASEYPSDGKGDSDYYEFVISDNRAIAYFRRKEDQAMGTVYIGCDSKARAKSWGVQISNLFDGTSHELRKGHRLTDYRYELKVWGLSANDIELLEEQDFSKTPSENFEPKLNGQYTELTCEVDPQPEPAEEPLKTGARVQICSDRHGTKDAVGIVTATSAVGAVVAIDGTKPSFYRFDELEAAPKKQTATAG